MRRDLAGVEVVENEVTKIDDRYRCQPHLTSGIKRRPTTYVCTHL